MCKILWIDDMRDPNEPQWQRWIKQHYNYTLDNEVIWVKSYDECVNWINENGLPQVVCFDHDLGDVADPDNEKTGYDCCKYIINYCMDRDLDAPLHFIQSSNPVGYANINSHMKTYRRWWYENHT